MKIKKFVPNTTNRWDRSHGEYIAGRALLDGVDVTAVAAEEKWGNGRLRLLVDAPMREKFDRQRYLLNAAILNGTLEDIRREAPRMITAYKALDRAADLAGADRLPPTVWEVTLEDGSVVEVKGNEQIEYDGEVHTAANLFDALKEGYYGKF